MTWWTWMLLGIALLGAEMIVPGGFFMLFFGFGAIIVGIAVLIGLGGPDWMQWLLFSAASIAMIVLLRKKALELLHPANGAKDVDSLVGATAISLDVIAPGQVGKVELRGSSWNGHNLSSAAIQKGHRCRVERVEGLTLFIVNEKNN